MPSGNKKVAALMVSDLHLSLEPPIARSGEINWLNVQARYLNTLRQLASHYDVPVLCAGDIFHHWKSSPELINFALEYLPDGMYCVPGQHDMPHHERKLDKSAYGVLARAGKIVDMRYGDLHVIKDSLNIYPYPWGYVPDLKPKKKFGFGRVNIAVTHAYCWNASKKFPGAPEQARVGNFKLKGYDVAVFGDNHIPFMTTHQGCVVFNHGCFIRRASNERYIRPAIGVVNTDGGVELHLLDTSRDVWLPEERANKLEHEIANVSQLVSTLEELGDSSENFSFALKSYFRENEVPRGVRSIITTAIEAGMENGH